MLGESSEYSCSKERRVETECQLREVEISYVVYVWLLKWLMEKDMEKMLLSVCVWSGYGFYLQQESLGVEVLAWQGYNVEE